MLAQLPRRRMRPATNLTMFVEHIYAGDRFCLYMHSRLADFIHWSSSGSFLYIFLPWSNGSCFNWVTENCVIIVHVPHSAPNRFTLCLHSGVHKGHSQKQAGEKILGRVKMWQHSKIYSTVEIQIKRYFWNQNQCTTILHHISTILITTQHNDTRNVS